MKRFYANNVVMQKNNEVPRVGKAICLDHEQQNLSKVQLMKTTLLKQVIDEK